MADRNREMLHAPPQRAVAGGNVGAYNNLWLEPGTRPAGRTSIIVDPPNGRLPARTPDGERRHAAHAASFPYGGPFDSWEDIEVTDRCFFWSAGPPMLPTFYNNNFLIVQNPDYVAIHYEMIHDTRVIPLDGRPHLPTDVRQWLGDARGHWDGDTLVVETRNIRRTEANASTGGLKGLTGAPVPVGIQFSCGPPTAVRMTRSRSPSGSRDSMPAHSCTRSRSTTPRGGRGASRARFQPWCCRHRRRSTSSPVTRATTPSGTSSVVRVFSRTSRGSS